MANPEEQKETQKPEPKEKEVARKIVINVTKNNAEVAEESEHSSVFELLAVLQGIVNGLQK